MRVGSHTLEKLLAGIFAEEGVMSDWTSEVVDHELEDRLNILLGVASVVGESSVLMVGQHI